MVSAARPLLYDDAVVEAEPQRRLGLSRPTVRLRPRRPLRLHWARDAVRVSVLVAADLVVFLALRGAVRGLRDGLVAGSHAAEVVSHLFPNGFLGGWHFAIGLLGSLLITGAYGAGDQRRDSGRTLAGVSLAALLVLYGRAWTQPLLGVTLQYAATVTAFGAALIGARLLVDRAVRWARPRIAPSRALLVTHDEESWAGLAGVVGRAEDFVVVRSLEISNGREAGVDEQLHELGETIDQVQADTVLIWGHLSDAEFAIITDVALARGLRLLTGPRTMKVAGVEPRVVWANGRQLVELTAPSLQGWQLVAKRVLDVAGAAVGLLLLSPVMLVTAVAIKLDSPGPVLFGHRRLGAQGRPFGCLKFRSMKPNAEAILRSDPALCRKYLENHFKLPAEQDPRLTRVGRFLRRTSLDELPQLFNVLLGQMSLVGPRPIVPAELHEYGNRGAPLFLSLKPGMTGAWAVNGRSRVGYPDRADLELQYVRRWSLVTDVGILLRTVPAVLRGRGAF